MTQLRVVVGNTRAKPQSPDVATETRALWDQSDAAPGVQSIPALLAARLPEIRQQLIRFVYDLGRLPVHGRQVQERLKAGASLSMWWCSLLFEKHPKVLPAVYPALKARALEIYIQEQGFTSIILEGNDEKLHTLLTDFCARTGRTFSHVPSLAPEAPAPSSLREKAHRAYYALPGPCKALGRFLVWWWKIRRHLPRTHSPAPCPESLTGTEGFTGATIATYFPNIDPKLAEQGRFRSRYWESLHEALRALPEPEPTAEFLNRAPQHSPRPPRKIHWLFMLFPSPQYSFAACRALRERFAAHSEATADPCAIDGASFHFLEEFLYPRDLVAACVRYVRLALSSARIQSAVRAQCTLPGSAMNIWPYLGPAFADSFRGWRCLERCLHQIAFTRYVAWAGPQEWTIFPLENCPWERMLTQAVHEAPHGSRPVYGTQHSTVRPTDFRYFDDPRTFTSPDCALFQPDIVCGNGQGACHEMRAAGLPPARMGMIEALRYMYLYRPEGPCPPQTVQGRLLIVTSFFADEVADHMRVLADVHHAGMLKNWQVTLKAHPYLAVDDYLHRLMPDHTFTLSTAPIGDLLTSGTMVWASNSTTVALEAALHGLPVMVQLPANDVDLCPLQGIEGVARIANAQHVAAALKAPQHAHLASEYLALDPALPRWRTFLKL
ncbi:MAG: hypothetical protein RRY29_02525 [Desulfovibrionaceae bacterium]